MIQKELKWESVDGLKFFAHTWNPDGNARAIIVLIHGFGEHCMRYTPYIEYFTDQNIAVLGFDLRGHGQTQGKRGAIKSYNHLMNDIEMALVQATHLYPDIPKFIYGHSMGGNLAMNYLISKQPDLKGAIITSPWLALTNDPNFILKGLVSFLKTMLPNLTIDSGLELEFLSTDPKEVEKYRTDPLNHGRISFRLFSNITNKGLLAIVNSSKIGVPVLLMHGSGDKITSPKASQIAAKNNPTMINFQLWPNQYHELHNEPNRPEIAQKVIDWINQQLK